MESTKFFKINYSPSPKLDLEIMMTQVDTNDDDTEHNYNPFFVHSFQNYNPIHKLFFKMKPETYNEITWNHKYSIVDMTSIKDNETNDELSKEVFIKHSPLLDPIKYMVGKYDIGDNKLRTLPQMDSTIDVCHHKLISANNSSYVDTFFSFLSSKLLHEHDIENCIDFYGSFLAVQEKFKMNITDDFEYLHDSNFFLENLKNHFAITKHDFLSQFMNNNSRRNRNKLKISNTNVNDKLENIEINDSIEITDLESNLNFTSSKDIDMNELEEIYKKKDSDNSDENEDSSSSEEEDEDYDGDDDSESDEDSDESSVEINMEVHAYINNFPVQMICLEKCDGLFDDLLEGEDLSVDEASAALMQIVMILLIYQKAFHFTHNDLHTNNIMYMNTNKKYIYYKFNKQVYRVPTYGKIYKLIDFGRSIYKFRNKVFCSDSFAPGGDASSQYNCEPFFNENKPKIEPNYSFDLCRLGCSIYDFIIDEEEYEDMNEFQQTVYRWCLDDNDLSILYKKNGSERYPDFKLYKMIARTVHKHTPQNQLEYPFFSQYEFNENVEHSDNVMDIDNLPCYV